MSSTQTGNNELSINPLSEAAVQIEAFGIELPQSVVQGFDEPTLLKPNPSPIVVVGTISRFRKSVMIWFGWGQEESNSLTDKLLESFAGSGGFNSWFA